MNNVTKVEALNNYILKLEFNNSEIRYFDLKNYLNHGIFKELQDINVFRTVKLYYDTINWINGADICPDTLFNQSKSYLHEL